MKITTLPNLDSTPQKIDWGARIYFARTACGLTQLELAQQIGLKSATAISLMEENKRGLHVHQLQLIAHVCKKPLAYFFDSL